MGILQGLGRADWVSQMDSGGRIVGATLCRGEAVGAVGSGFQNVCRIIDGRGLGVAYARVGASQRLNGLKEDVDIEGPCSSGRDGPTRVRGRTAKQGQLDMLRPPVMARE